MLPAFDLLSDPSLGVEQRAVEWHVVDELARELAPVRVGEAADPVAQALDELAVVPVPGGVPERPVAAGRSVE